MIDEALVSTWEFAKTETPCRPIGYSNNIQTDKEANNRLNTIGMEMYEVSIDLPVKSAQSLKESFLGCNFH